MELDTHVMRYASPEPHGRNPGRCQFDLDRSRDRSRDRGIGFYTYNHFRALLEVADPGHVKQRTWERGSGETRACGTGACAVCVAGVLTGRTDGRLVSQLPGGELLLEWDGAGSVFMTGPAVEVFTGDWKGGG